MPNLAQAARNGALAAIGLYLILTSIALALSYASLQQHASSIAQPGPLHSLASRLPPLLGTLSRS